MRRKILGPPGTGKTHRALDLFEKELARGIRPDRIGFLTFTKKAVEEAVTRIADRFNIPAAHLPYVRTLHSLCHRQLGLTTDRVLDGKKMQAFAQYAGVELSDGLDSTDEDASLTEGDRILAWMHTSRARCLPYKEAFKTYTGTSDWSYVDWFIQTYETYKAANYLVDFTDFLTVFLDKGKPLSLATLFIDEAQDLSPLQWRVVEILSANTPMIYVIGDDDQAIYAWSGADATSFIKWQADQTEVLPKSWRLPRQIHRVAQGIVQCIDDRLDKVFQARDDEGRVSWINSIEAVEPKASGSTMVLYRNHYLGKAIEDELRWRGVPYLGRRSPFKRPGELLAIQTWERLREGKTVAMASVQSAIDLVPALSPYLAKGAKQTIRMKPSKGMMTKAELSGLGVKAIVPWRQMLTQVKQIDVVERLISHNGLDVLSKKPSMTLSTIHQAKGGEADRVYLMTEMGSRTYKHFKEQPNDEHRVFYVGATRAKHELVFIYSKSSKCYDNFGEEG